MTATPKPPSRGGRRRGGLVGSALRLRRTQIGLALALPVAVLALIGPWLAPVSPNKFVGAPFEPPSVHGPFGTDVLGRDVWSRFLAGGRTTLLMALAAAALGVAIGTALGLIAASSRTSKGELIMRSLDVLLAFPQYVLVLLVVSLIGASIPLTVFVISLGWVPVVARVMRAAGIEVAQRDFVQYSRTLGTSRTRVIAGDILGNVTAPLSVELGLRITFAVALITGLSYLGFGVPPPAPAWGSMISENQIGLTVQPWGVLLPVLAVAILTVGTNLITEGFARASAGTGRPALGEGLATEALEMIDVPDLAGR